MQKDKTYKLSKKKTSPENPKAKSKQTRQGKGNFYVERAIEVERVRLWKQANNAKRLIEGRKLITPGPLHTLHHSLALSNYPPNLTHTW
jgi:hypothetical protein